MYGENYFRDVFNFVYGYSFENANFETQNAACVDLIDKSEKLAYQITTTCTKKKIEKTLAALQKQEYKDYSIKIFYLLEKPELSKKIATDIETTFNINILTTNNIYISTIIT